MASTHSPDARPLDVAFITAWARRWLDAWNARDVDGLVSMCSEDIVWDDPALPETVRGHEGVRGFLEAIFRTFPDVQIEAHEGIFLTLGPRALSPYRLRATMAADWEPWGIHATGRRFEYRGIDEWEFRDGLLVRYNTHYDSLGAARQLGVLQQYASRAT
jgi:steroid delta-isomerase-like uncharacterized protein